MSADQGALGCFGCMRSLLRVPEPRSDSDESTWNLRVFSDVRDFGKWQSGFARNTLRSEKLRALSTDHLHEICCKKLPMTSNNSNSSVNSGIPWWIWVLIVPVTIAVIVGTVLSQIPEDPEAIYTETRALLDSGNIEAAETQVARLDEFPDYSSHAELIRGILAYARQREPIAIQHLQKASEHPDLKSEAFEIMGGSYARTGDYRNAVRSYQQATEADPDNVNALLKLAQFHFAIGGIHHAVKLVEDLIEDGNKAALTLRATARFDLGRYEEALKDYARLLETPGDRAAASPDLIDRYVVAALETDNKEHIEIAVDEFARMMANKMLSASLHAASGDTDSAKRMIEEMQHLSEYPGISKLQADVAYRLGDFKQAENFILKAVPLYPRDRATYQLARKIFEESGNEQALKATVENIEQLNDLQEQFRNIVAEIGDDIENAQLRVDAVDVLIQLAQPQDAIKWNQVASIIDPSLDLPSTADVMTKVQALPALVPLAPEPPTNRPKPRLPVEEDAKKDASEEAGSDTKEADAGKSESSESPAGNSSESSSNDADETPAESSDAGKSEPEKDAAAAGDSA